MTQNDRFAVIGNGPGGCAAAASLVEAGYGASLYGRTQDKVALLAAAPGMTVVEDARSRLVPGIRHTNCLSDALSGTQNVILMVPTSAVPSYARNLAPLLSPESRVLLAPGHTGGALAFRAALRAERPDLGHMVVAETYTLPYVTRMTGPTEVTIWHRMADLLTGALPGSQTESVVNVFLAAFPNLVPARSVLETSLSNLNAIMHPPGVVGNIGWIEHTDGEFRFYSEGITPSIGRMMSELDVERLQIARAFGLDLPDFLTQFHAAGMISGAQLASGSFYEAVRHSAANREIRAPASLSHRYIVEDIGCGLVALSAIAAVAAVAVPVTDATIVLTQAATGVDYREEGLNASALGLAGLNRAELLASI